MEAQVWLRGGTWHSGSDMGGKTGGGVSCRIPHPCADVFCGPHKSI